MLDGSRVTMPETQIAWRARLWWGVAGASAFTIAGALASSTLPELLVLGVVPGFVVGFFVGPWLLREVVWRWFL